MRTLYSCLEIAACASIIASVGCIEAPAERAPREDVGSIRLELLGQAPSGRVYRLRHAVITVTGSDSTTVWNTDDSPDQISLSANVAAGEYNVSLADGWILELVEGSMSTSVPAALTSPNPAPFTVAALSRTQVPLRFTIDDSDDQVDMSQGYDITLAVTEPSPPLWYVTSPGSVPPSIRVFPSAGAGNLAPLQTIAGSLTTLQIPRGIAVTEDQIIVADEGTAGSTVGWITFFPITANGNVAPTRRISVPKPDQITVSNGELYVPVQNGIIVTDASTGTGGTQFATASTMGAVTVANDEIFAAMKSARKIGVFSRSGGLVRSISNSPQPNCISGLSVYRGELYVTNGCLGQILVYPQTWSGEPAPVRTMTIGEVGSTVVSKGELFIAAFAEDALRVVPTTGIGAVTPTRSIAGSMTGLVDPSGVALR